MATFYFDKLATCINATKVKVGDLVYCSNSLRNLQSWVVDEVKSESGIITKIDYDNDFPFFIKDESGNEFTCEYVYPLPMRYMTCTEVLEKLKETGFAVKSIRQNKILTVTEINHSENYIVTVELVKSIREQKTQEQNLFTTVLSYNKLSPKDMSDNFLFLDGTGFQVEE